MDRLTFIVQDMSWLYNHKAQFSLGTLYVSTSLKEKGVEVDLFDTNDREILEIDPADVFAFSTMYNTYPDTVRLARLVREIYPQATIIMGGVHPTQVGPRWGDRNDQIIEDLFDAIFIGEAEESIKEFVDDYRKKRVKKVYNRTTPAIDTLYPDRYMPPEDYIRTPSMFAKGKNYVGGGSTAVILSRGCPFLCAFCSSPNFWERKVRYRSMDNIKKEISDIIESWGIRQLRIQDDTFTLNYRFVKELCALLEPMNVFWRCSTRVDTLVRHEDFSEMMYSAGCREVGVGIEAADDEVLKKLLKGQTVDIMYRAVEQLQKAGIKVRQYFLIGTPYDSYETMEKNIDFIERTGAVDVAVGNLIPFPGDDLYINKEKHGIRAVKDETCMNIGTHLELRPNILRHDISEEEHISIMKIFFDYLVNKGYLKGILDQEG